MRKIWLMIFLGLSALSLIGATLFQQATKKISFSVINGTNISSYFILVYVLWFVGAFSFSFGIFLLMFFVFSRPRKRASKHRTWL